MQFEREQERSNLAKINMAPFFCQEAGLKTGLTRSDERRLGLSNSFAVPAILLSNRKATRK
jgi:hypothetical protein